MRAVQGFIICYITLLVLLLNLRLRSLCFSVKLIFVRSNFDMLALKVHMKASQAFPFFDRQPA